MKPFSKSTLGRLLIKSSIPQGSGADGVMLFTTTGFQSGAIKYARVHRIALVSIIDGAATYHTRSAFPVDAKPPAWLNLPKFSLWHVGENDTGNITMKSLGRADTELDEMFGD